MNRQIIQTKSAPQAIGPYSQAIRVGDLVFTSGQIPLDPASGQLVNGDIDAEIRQVFANLSAVAEAAGTSLSNAIKLTIFLTDLGNFAKVNDCMAQQFSEPYPARSTIGVAQLPKGARVEIDCVLYIG